MASFKTKNIANTLEIPRDLGALLEELESKTKHQNKRCCQGLITLEITEDLGDPCQEPRGTD